MRSRYTYWIFPVRERSSKKVERRVKEAYNEYLKAVEQYAKALRHDYPLLSSLNAMREAQHWIERNAGRK